MSRLGIERKPSEGFCQFKIELAYFEEKLNCPAFSIKTDDFILEKEVGCNQNQIIIAFIPVSDKDKADQYDAVIFLNRSFY